LPAKLVVDIGCGRGRWDGYLRGFCDELVLVDVAESCVSFCKERFARDGAVRCFLGDGSSLDMVDDGTVGFAFSWNSLFHAEMPEIEGYVKSLSKKLAPDGAAFIHHSNFGHYRRSLSAFGERLLRSREQRSDGGGMGRLASAYWKANPLLIRLGLEVGHGAATSVTAEGVLSCAEANRLCCISQERFNWTWRKLTDCISVLAPKGSKWDGPMASSVNHGWVTSARLARVVGNLYGERP